MDLLQVSRRLVQDGLERRPDVSLLQVTGKRRSIAFSDNHVDVQRGFCRRRESHVADHGGDLDLLVHGIVDIVLLVPVEIADVTSANAPMPVT